MRGTDAARTAYAVGRVRPLAVPIGAAIADTKPPARSRPLVVVVAEAPPFATRSVGGDWDGLSIDLWKEIARRLDLRYELRPTNIEGAVTALDAGTADAAIGVISVNAAGAATHDFSHAYLATGIGVAKRTGRASLWQAVRATLGNPQLLRVVAVLAVATLVVGALMALIERRRERGDFGGPLRQGVSTGVWWAAETMTTVGYGDATPKSLPGRLLALLWMFVGVAAVAIFTASVTSALTVARLDGMVRNPADLTHMKIGAVQSCASPGLLRDRHIGATLYPTHAEALAALAAGRIDAVVANIPVMRSLVKAEWQGDLEVSPVILVHISYAIGLPRGSPLRDAINRTLLEIVEQDWWQEVLHRYLGHP